MTREEAIKWLKVELHTWEIDCKSKHAVKDALRMAIKALEQEPSDTCTNLCKSCDTKGCIFQSGIKREKCDFYTSEKEVKMTDKERELALYCLKASSDYHSEVCEECIKYPNCDHTGQDDVIESIIKELESQPCTDAISRQAVLEQTYNWSKDEFLRITNPFDYLRKRINSLLPVTPQLKMGYWIDTGSGQECSECHEIQYGYDNHRFYCGSCGAKMVDNTLILGDDTNE